MKKEGDVWDFIHTADCSEIKREWRKFIIDSNIKEDIKGLVSDGRIRGIEMFRLIERYALKFAERYKELSK